MYFPTIQMSPEKAAFKSALESLRDAVKNDDDTIIVERSSIAWQLGAEYKLSTTRFVDIGILISDASVLGQRDRAHQYH